MIMDQHPSEAALSDFLAGECDPAARDALSSHLDRCALCQSVAERLTRIDPELAASVFVAKSPLAADEQAAVPSVPGYENLRELGRGGCGVVYRARETSTGREIAIKVLRGGVLAGRSERDRFVAEVRAAGKLRHPNIITVLSVGEAAELCHYTMEFLPGGSLADKLDGTPMRPRAAAATVMATAEGISHAHDHGVIHRDIKPGNILLDGPSDDPDAWIPKVSDFGMAKHDESGSAVTPSQAVLGTPSYMAPEQAFGKSRQVGPAADVYALGAVLYELLTGRPPFRGETHYDTLLLVRDTEPVPPRLLLPKLPRDLETICLKCLEKEPSRRYATAKDLAKDLGAFLAGRPVAARPVGRLGRLVRWARREPALAALSTFTLLLLSTLLVYVTLSLRTAREQARKLADANSLAEDRGEKLLEFVVFAADSSSRLFNNPGLVSELDRQSIIEYVEQLGELPDLSGFPEKEHELAYAILQMTNGLHNLGEYQKATRPTERAVAILARLAKSHPDRPMYAYHYAEGCMQVAGLANQAGRSDDGIAAHEEAVRVATDLTERFPEVPGFAMDLASFRGQLAQDRLDRGRIDEAETLALLSLQGQRRAVAKFPDDPTRYRFYSSASRGYGKVLLRRGDRKDQYWNLVQERIELCEQARKQKDWPLMAMKLIDLDESTLLNDAGMSAECKQLTAYALTVYGELAGRDEANPKVQEDLARWFIVDAHHRWGSDPAAARRNFRRAIEILDRLQEDSSRITAARGLANLLSFCPDPTLRDPKKALQCARKLPTNDPEDALLLGMVLYDNGQAKAACEQIKAFLLIDKHSPTDSCQRTARHYLSLARKQLGEPEPSDAVR
ncbi:MAG: protein kinase [Isosphaeraceae bacterium]|nr:protein kinase [Isosphaeraceae bacterium]